MNLRNRPFASRRTATGKPPFTRLSVRPLALLLMLAGVVGFVVARLMFGEQMLCLFGSTLLTFSGLGLILAARRYGWGTQTGTPLAGQEPMADPAQTWMGQLGQRQTAPKTQAAKEQVIPKPQTPKAQGLSARVMAHFEEQGAAVTQEASRPGRSILQVRAPGGLTCTVLVLESPGAVDVAEARALLALVSESGSTEGYLIAAGAFTQRVVAWVQGKPLQLVEAGRLSRIRL